MLVEYDSGRSCVTPQRKGMKTLGSDRCPRMGPFLAKVYRSVSRTSTSASVGTVLLLLSLIQSAAGQMQPGLHRSNPAAIGFPRVLDLEANRGESTGVLGCDSRGPMAPAAGPVITTLDLYDGRGTLLASNDDWHSTQEQQIIDTTIPPTDPRESAIVATLNPGNYTAIVRGKNNTTGVALGGGLCVAVMQGRPEMVAKAPYR